jgi:hypothetical protein
LPFSRDAIRDPIEMFGPDKNNRPPLERVTRVIAGVVLIDAG